MTRPCPHEPACFESSTRDAPQDGRHARRVVGLVAIGPDWRALLAEWLGEAGWKVRDLDLDSGRSTETVGELIVLEAAFPRRQAAQRVERVRARWPRIPVLLLSPTFHAGIAVRGALARELGVEATVPMPVARERLLAVMQQLVDGAG